MPQLNFDFIPVMDTELAEKRKQEANLIPIKMPRNFTGHRMR